jgi:hypothetical protein
MPRYSRMQSKTLVVIAMFVIVVVDLIVWLSMRHIIFSTFPAAISAAPASGMIFDTACLIVAVGAIWAAVVR